MPSVIVSDSGKLVIEGYAADQLAAVRDLLGDGDDINCAKPLPVQYVDLAPHAAPADEETETARRFGRTIRVHAIWGGDVTAGPGTRAVIQMQGCPIRCPGCYVPGTHDAAGGVEMRVSKVAWLASSLGHRRVTIMGGEPFAQPAALAILCRELRLDRGCELVLYTGFTAEWLAGHIPAAREIFRMVDMVIDGPFRRDLTEGAGEWRGSTNQRVIERPYRLIADTARHL